MALAASKEGQGCSPCQGRGLSRAVAGGPGAAGGTRPSVGAGSWGPRYKLGWPNRARWWEVSHLDEAPPSIFSGALTCFPEAGVSGFLGFCSFPPRDLF